MTAVRATTTLWLPMAECTRSPLDHDAPPIHQFPQVAAIVPLVVESLARNVCGSCRKRRDCCGPAFGIVTRSTTEPTILALTFDSTIPERQLMLCSDYAFVQAVAYPYIQ
jgi:hypothetical protein